MAVYLVVVPIVLALGLVVFVPVLGGWLGALAAWGTSFFAAVTVAVVLGWRD